VRRLTSAPHGSFEPHVSPDGQRIAFSSSRDGAAELYVMNADGSVPVRLTQSRPDDLRPRWAPDGQRLGFISHRGGRQRVWLTDDRGRHPTPLLPDSVEGTHLDLAWSPRGDQIALVNSTPTDPGAILIVDPSDHSVVITLNGPGVDEQPEWGPSGDWLAFVSSRHGAPNLFIARAEDGWTVQRTFSDHPQWLPRWVPPH